jgi:hypothetical protein
MTDDDKHDLIWEIRYGMRFGRRQARLLDRMAMVLKIATILAGSTAFVAVLGKHDDLVKWSGLAVAALGLLDAFWNPAGRAYKTREIETRYAMLDRDADHLNASDLKRRIAELYDAEAPELGTLRPIVYNDVVTELGDSESEKMQLNWWQSMVRVVA